MSYQFIKNGDFMQIIKQLNNHIPIIMPTDTVWGILSSNEANIYALKQRDADKKIIQFVKCDYLNCFLNNAQQLLINKFWPGNLTVIINDKAYRCPNDDLLLKIIDMVDVPLYCSSANITGEPVINCISSAIKSFEKSMINFCIYEAISDNNLPSTIINIDDWTILRTGEIGNEIIEFLKDNHILCKQ